MGLRNTLKKMLGARPEPSTNPPVPRVRSRAVYRVPDARPIEVHPEPDSGETILSPAGESPRTDGVWQIHLVHAEQGLDLTFDCSEEDTILDRAEELGIDLPYSCRGGGCTVCAGKVLDGEVEQEDQYVLVTEDLEQGFRLLCCARPRANVRIRTHMGDLTEEGR